MKTNRNILLSLLIVFLESISYAQSGNPENLLPNPGFEQPGEGIPGGWKTFIPRKEIAPVFTTDNSVARTGKFSLCISSGGSEGTYGWVSSTAEGIDSGAEIDLSSFKGNTVPGASFLSDKSYKIGCFYKTEGMQFPERHVRIKATWKDRKGNELLTSFLSGASREGDWLHASQVMAAPHNAASVTLCLILQWTPTGKVWWDDAYVLKTENSPARKVKVATSTERPKAPSTTEANLEYYSGIIADAGSIGVDLLCLGEGITVVSTKKSYAEAGEPVPGPTTKALGEAAKKARTWVVAGLYERDGQLVYNTAVLIDRQGNIAGKYRKVHLPQAEVEGGLMPGDDYPVFHTDFGTIGIEICYDNFFPEEARSLMLNGAEIILVPIWGDIRGDNMEWNVVARARAIDNAVFIVASMYDINGSMISDPNGKVLSDTGRKKGLIVSDIDLNMRTFERWLSMKSFGEWKNLMPQERRAETYGKVR